MFASSYVALPGRPPDDLNNGKQRETARVFSVDRITRYAPYYSTDGICFNLDVFLYKYDYTSLDIYVEISTKATLDKSLCLALVLLGRDHFQF